MTETSNQNLNNTSASPLTIKLTPEQKRAMDFIEKYGAIVRYEGGFWAKPNDEKFGFIPKEIGGRMKEDCYYPLDYVGTNTIKALLKKGVIKVSKEREGKYGKFPVECVKT